jgi:hypothetical protein
MKARLLANGELIVSADNEVEAYALKVWDSKRRGRSGEAKLVIDIEGEWKTWEGLQRFHEVMKPVGSMPARFQEWLKLEREREKAQTIEGDGGPEADSVLGQNEQNAVADAPPPK